MQKAQAEQDKKRTLMCVIHLGRKENRFVPLAAPDVPEITLSDEAKVAVGMSDLRYRALVSWDQEYTDVYLVDVSTGSPQENPGKDAQRRPAISGRGLAYLFQRSR